MRTKTWLGGAAAGALLLAALPAPAQTEPAPAAEPQAQPVPAVAVEPAAAEPQPGEVVVAPAAPAPGDIEEIVVTGSRINRADLNTPAPVTVVSREQIVQSGRASVGDILQSLPAQSNAINPQVNNGGDGSTRVNLRGLGSARTLVLLNGRRFVPGGRGADDSVDLSAIPMAAIERVEILKDGASAIYGSDAIGGVVNIITRKNWTGTEVSAFGGMSQRGDGQVVDLSVTTGQKLGSRAYMLFTGGYYRQEPVWAGDRVWSRVDKWYDFASGELSTTGISGVPNGLIVDNEGYFGEPGYEGNPNWQALTDAYGAGNALTLGGDGRWRPFRDDQAEGYGGDLYNYMPVNYLVTPAQRLNMMLNAHLKLGEGAKAYVETTFTNRQSDIQLAPEPLYTSLIGVTVSKDNVYNPFGRDFGDVRRRLVEFGPRRQSDDQTTFRIVGGLNGHLPDSFGPLAGWFWDVSVNYGRNSGTELLTGNLQVSRVANAVGPSFFDGAGVARCGRPGAVIEGCVPLNLFGGAGSIDEAMRDYLSFVGTRRAVNEQTMLSVSAAGDLFHLFASRPVSLAAGYELRHEFGASIPDPLTAKGDTTGNIEAPTQGSFTVNEGYLELSLPIVSGKPAAENLEIMAALRAFNYDTFGSDFIYKLGGRWQIIRDVSLRGTFSSAFRAPSITELYSGHADSFLDVQDPCSGATGEVAQRCRTLGKQVVPEGFKDNRGAQLRVILGGNPDLEPEKAETFTVGTIIEPRFLKGFSLTVDYYNIKVTNSIASLGPDVILNGCYLTDNPNRDYCDKITRDRFGYVTSIDDTNHNVGGDQTAGLDFGARYDFGSPIGRFSVTADVNWIQLYDTTLADGTVIHGKGNFDLGNNAPVRAMAGVTWGYKGVGAGVHGRFVSELRQCDNNRCELPDGSEEPKYRVIPAYAVADLFLSYDLKSSLGKTGFLFGVNNVFDEAPRALYNINVVPSDETAYDFLGRYFYLKLSHSF